MNNLWLKIRVWTKAVIAVLLLIYILSFIANNSGQTVEFWYWFFAGEVKTSLLVFTFLTFAFGVIVALLIRAIFKTLRQFRELREKNRIARLERENAEMRTKAAMLKTREGPAPSSSVE